jgi:D-amino peptidase
MRRLFMSADIEGVAGVASWDQTREGRFDYQAARGWFTGEVAACARAALDAGFDEIIVADSHGNGQSLLIDQMPERVRLVRSWPRPLMMMQGVDLPGVEGAVLLGYHTGAHHAQGLLAHTIHGAVIAELWLDGALASETTLSALTAGHFGVPVILATGDDDYAVHAAEEIPGVKAVSVKTAFGRISALSDTPAMAQAKIAAATIAALAREKPALVRRAGPIAARIVCKQHWTAELLSYLPGFRRDGATGISWTSDDAVALNKALTFITSYEPLPR